MNNTALIQELRKKCSGKIITKNVPFLNDDVPNYLRILADLEERSKHSSIVVK